MNHTCSFNTCSHCPSCRPIVLFALFSPCAHCHKCILLPCASQVVCFIRGEFPQKETPWSKASSHLSSLVFQSSTVPRQRLASHISIHPIFVPHSQEMHLRPQRIHELLPYVQNTAYAVWLPHMAWLCFLGWRSKMDGLSHCPIHTHLQKHSSTRFRRLAPRALST